MIPRHLEKIFRPDQKDESKGKIVCECGCNAFEILYCGEFNESKNKLYLTKFKGKYLQAVRAVCSRCGNSYLLYDFALHCHDGLIYEDGTPAEAERMTRFSTKNDSLFEAEMSVEYFTQEAFEVILDDEEARRRLNLTPENRADIWCWVVIDLTGTDSGKKYNNFVNEELS